MTTVATSRRGWLALAGTSVLLAACGFKLRAPVELPYRRLALQGFAKNAPMVDEIRLALPATVRLVETANEADAVVVVLRDQFTRTVAASTSASEVREFRLRVVLRFRLTGPDGQEWLPVTELERSRDMSYTETAALAKEAEQAALVHDMRADLARQLLDMLAATGRQPR